MKFNPLHSTNCEGFFFVARFLPDYWKNNDPNLPGEMITSIRLEKVSTGTELKVVQEGIPAVIPLDMCYLGWQESLDKLVRLVEPEIPDA